MEYVISILTLLDACSTTSMSSPPSMMTGSTTSLLLPKDHHSKRSRRGFILTRGRGWGWGRDETGKARVLLCQLFYIYCWCLAACGYADHLVV
jgi:hypothetical protein